MTPIFETKSDRARERVVGEAISGWKNWRLVQCLPLDPADFAVWDGPTAIGLLEVKCRNWRYGVYKPFISKKKVDYSIGICKTLGLRYFVAWCWTDAIQMIELNSSSRFRVLKDFGRTKQTRPNAHSDIEDMYEFENQGMELLCFDVRGVLPSTSSTGYTLSSSTNEATAY